MYHSKFCAGTLKDFDEFYKRVFERSQLKLMTGKVRPDVHLQDWRSNFTKVPWKMSEVNLFILPYIEAENDSDEERDENDSDSSGYEGWSSGMLRLAKPFLNAMLFYVQAYLSRHLA